ncbi:MAG: Tyrosine recombinase XerC [Acidobacteria bacterium ADurb.Bin340]|nr:MAG: Tyrosine recombinase XerC [Acidobacteria bacterium ADurb.Bin340]
MRGPSLFRVGQIWHYRYQLDGQRVQRSTRETLRLRAELVAEDAWEAAKLRARGQEPEPTLRELVGMWEQAHLLPLSPSHVSGVVRNVLAHAGELLDLRLGQVTTEGVEACRNTYLQGHARSSANLLLAQLRLLYGWALRRRMIRQIPWHVKRLRVQEKPRRLLPVAATSAWLEEVEALAEREPGMALAIRLMVGLGLRESEVVTARWEWLDLERGTYTPGATKGREAYPRPVPAWILDELRPVARPWGPMATTVTGKRLTAGRIQRVLDSACRAVGIPRLTAHRLRGTYATLLAEAGVPLPDIQRAMGHKDVRTTLRYLEHDMQRVARAQIRLAERMGLSAGRKNGEPCPPRAQGA